MDNVKAKSNILYDNSSFMFGRRHSYVPWDRQRIDVIYTGNIITTRQLEFYSPGCSIRKLDKNSYVSLSTGEIKFFKHNGKRIDNYASLTKSFARIRDLINCNITPKTADNVLFVTLTYAENMTDNKRLYVDTDKFLKRLRYKHGNFEYISVIEPQARGAWHIHIFVIFPNKAPFIPNDEMASIWGHGFTKTEKINSRSIDNMGAYFVAYFTDIETDNVNGAKTVTDKDGNSKRIIKGGRLYLYPVGMHFYRASRGIKKPLKKIMTVKKFIQTEICKKYHMTFKKTYDIVTPEFRNTLTVCQFNLSKPKTIQDIIDERHIKPCTEDIFDD